MLLYDKFALFCKKGWINPKYQEILQEFFASYLSAALSLGGQKTYCENMLSTFLDQVTSQLKNPYRFQPYHEKIRTPFDHYQFGLEFMRPLVDFSRSFIDGKSNLQKIETLLEKNHNVILLANHQIEGDPQAISLLLEKTFPKIGEEMIFVAGDRVITDPLSIPFSMGRNLLCIYSKKYIDIPPERREEKQLHNRKTLRQMQALLNSGGRCIYVAPSGGRDRIGNSGCVEVAPFDPQAVEMFYLQGKQAKQKTHFFTLALSTYHLLPPPKTTEIELGEKRTTQGGPICLCFGEEVSLDAATFPQMPADKQKKRQLKAKFIWEKVRKDYNKICNIH